MHKFHLSQVRHAVGNVKAKAEQIQDLEHVAALLQIILQAPKFKVRGHENHPLGALNHPQQLHDIVVVKFSLMREFEDNFLLIQRRL